MKRRNSSRLQEISISEFKKNSSSLLERVRKTKKALRVTRRVKPVADVVPSATESADRSWLGSMRGTFEITGDVVSPVIDLDDIDALRD
ncbi:MAG TPA: type II toxin-antitoxin system prevent-host-death family antitoxin [Candidatus Dormibacteraeota bacterium]|nr:type II toxin-antitoxin system prevent-host-death family antitoxin [Candidatus Dormibacteraeota bacterium]